MFKIIYCNGCTVMHSDDLHVTSLSDAASAITAQRAGMLSPEAVTE